MAVRFGQIGVLSIGTLGKVRSSMSVASQRSMAKIAIAEILGDSSHTSVKRWQSLARQLSAVAGRSKPWGWRYIQSVAAGTVGPGDRLMSALVMLATMRSDEGWWGGLREVTVMAMPYQNVHLAVLPPIDQVVCSECGIGFIPNVPWRKRCYACSPIRSF